MKQSLKSLVNILDLIKSASPNCSKLSLKKDIKIPEKFAEVTSLAKKNCGKCNNAAFSNIDSNINGNSELTISLNDAGSI